MTVWRVVVALFALALLVMSFWWERAEEGALKDAADVVHRADERVRQADEWAKEP